MIENIYRVRKLDTLSRIVGVFLFAAGTERLTQGHVAPAAALMASGFVLAVLTIPFFVNTKEGDKL